MIKKALNAFYALVGLILLLAVGNRTFHKIQQSHGILSWITKRFVNSISWIASNTFYMENARYLSRAPDVLLRAYGDDSLMGYGDPEYTKGGDLPLEKQQRGLILETLKARLTPEVKTVLEIGCGNGDIVAHIAAAYPDKKIMGIDFSVRNAQLKHPSLTFKTGYALDVINRLTPIDLVYMSSTACLFLPMELGAYLEEFRSAGIKTIVFNEPTWDGYVQTNDKRCASAHLENHVWYHNYAGYLRYYGYDVMDFKAIQYKHPISPRHDIVAWIIGGQR